jgi:NADH-quinone oxidoreductase subunit A
MGTLSGETPLWPLAVYFGGVLLLAAFMLVSSHLLGERHSDRGTGTPYESGITPTGAAWTGFDVKYYLIAMFFVIFDVESTFVYAWAAPSEAGWPGSRDGGLPRPAPRGLAYPGGRGRSSGPPFAPGGRRKGDMMRRPGGPGREEQATDQAAGMTHGVAGLVLTRLQELVAGGAGIPCGRSTLARPAASSRWRRASRRKHDIAGSGRGAQGQPQGGRRPIMAGTVFMKVAPVVKGSTADDGAALGDLHGLLLQFGRHVRHIQRVQGLDTFCRWTSTCRAARRDRRPWFRGSCCSSRWSAGRNGPSRG